MTISEALALGGSIVAGLGGGGVITAGLAKFIGKTWADRALEKERAEYQRLNTELQHNLNLTANRLQIELNAIGLMRNLRTTEEFSHLGALWKKLAILNAAFIQVCGNGMKLRPADATLSKKADDEERAFFWQAVKDAQQFFYENELFFPQKIADLAGETIKIAAQEQYYYAAFNGIPDPASRKNYNEIIESDLAEFREKLKTLKTMMRSHTSGTSTAAPAGDSESAFSDS